MRGDSKLALPRQSLSCSVLHVDDPMGHCQQKALVSRIEAKICVLNIFPVLSGQLVSHLEKVRIQWKRQASRSNNTVCSDHMPNVSL